MKPVFSFLSLWIFVSGLQAQNYTDYFSDQSLRFDYVHTGSATESLVYPVKFLQEPAWGGSRKNLIDTFEYGECMLRLYDVASSKLIYSRGYSTLFVEWQTTDEAKSIKRPFQESVSMPFPLKPVRLEILQRKKDRSYDLLYSSQVDPAEWKIIRDKKHRYPVHTVLNSGDPANHVDLVFIPEGYTQEEMEKFKADVRRFIDNMMTWSPFKDHAQQFNVSAVLVPSDESGTDVPGENIWRNTVLGSHFYTFGTARYLSVDEIWKMRDLAGGVPYDHVCVLVNSSRYGGGGFYNFATVCTSDDKASYFVFNHELGHGFFGLGDEYYDSEVAYEGFYDLSVEPWEPNITTLVDFGKKWKDMMMPGIPVPTPPEAKYKKTVGVFEGGGYMAKGIYRPWISCSMKDVVMDGFCPVCRRSIRQMIRFYSE